MNSDSDKLSISLRATTALWAIIRAVNPKGPILVPVNICEVVVAMFIHSSIKFRYYDVDSKEGNTSLSLIKDSICGNESILLLVHNFGSPVAETFEIKNWATENHLFLIEDICNAFGSRINGTSLGQFGDAVIYSFGYAKSIEIGFGGGYVVENPILKKKVEMLISQLPSISKEEYLRKDLLFQTKIRVLRKSSDLSGLRALYEKYISLFFNKLKKKDIEFVLSGLSESEEIISVRKKNASYYENNIRNPLVVKRSFHDDEVSWRYTFTISDRKKRDELLAQLWDNDIIASRWYPPINQLLPDGFNKDFPGAETFFKHVINLLVYDIDNEKMSKTVQIINNFRV